MPYTNQLHKLIFRLMLGVHLAGSAFGLQTDSEQPIKVKADSGEYNNLTGDMLYQGNVEFWQGSMYLKADKVVVKMVQGNASELFAFGKPAFFKQQPDDSETPMEAEGNEIQYQVPLGQIVISGSAKLNHESNQLSGNNIVYNLNDQNGKATGDLNSDGDGRIEMIIQPETLE